MSIDLDTSQDGLLTSRFDGDQTLDELEAYLQRFEAVIARDKPYVVITWMKSYTRSPRVIQRMGRWMKQTEEATRRLCAASAMIASPGFRFILSAIALVQPMPCPYHVCGSFTEAEAFVRGHAEKRGLPVARPFANPWAGQV